MTGIYSGNETKTAAWFCPKCGGADLTRESSELSFNRTVKCSCGWEGTVAELVTAPFKHELGTDEQILQSMMTDLRNILAKEFAKTFGSFLMKWGFISANVTPVELSKYMVAVAKATMLSIIEVRKGIEKERSGG